MLFFLTQEEAISSDFSYRQPLQLSLQVMHSDSQPLSAVDFTIKKIVNLGLNNIFTEESISKANQIVTASFDFLEDKVNNSQNGRSAKMLQNMFNLAKKTVYLQYKPQKPHIKIWLFNA